MIIIIVKGYAKLLNFSTGNYTVARKRGHRPECFGTKMLSKFTAPPVYCTLQESLANANFKRATAVHV